MREILFRGKRKDNGEWVEFTPLGALFANPLNIEVELETVGTYTGITDKNGKKIFEGDIVTGLFLFGRSVKAVATFQDGAFGLEWYRGDIKTFNAFTSICNVEYEVVGNIHDNPDLLESEDTE